MTAQGPIVKPKKALWRRLLKWTLRVATVLVVLAIAAYAGTSYWAAKTIHNEISRIRAAGEPLTFADLDALTPKVDRAQDAGPYYAAAAELANPDFELDDKNYDAFFGPNAPAVSPEILAKARRSLAENQLALELLDRGSALPGCNSDIQLEDGLFEAAFPHMSKTRNLLIVASLRSRVLAFDGNGDEAVESIISSLGLLRTMDRQPVIVDAMVQAAMIARVCGDVRFTLEKDHLSDAAMRRLSGALLRLHLIQPREIFIAERVIFFEITRNAISMGPRINPADPDGPALPNNAWSSLAGRIIIAKSLPDYARYIDAASGNWPGILTAVENIKPASWDLVSGTFARSMIVYAKALSAYRSTLVALQIERFRLAHAGRLPDSLGELSNSNELPKDPLTGNNLLYAKIADGYCVYSAGPKHLQKGEIGPDKDLLKWCQHWGAHVRINPR